MHFVLFSFVFFSFFIIIITMFIIIICKIAPPFFLCLVPSQQFNSCTIYNTNFILNVVHVFLLIYITVNAANKKETLTRFAFE